MHGIRHPRPASSTGQVCQHGMLHPSVRVLEVVQISNDLATRLGAQQNHVALFANINDLNRVAANTTHDKSALDPIHGDISKPEGLSSDGVFRNGTSWATIVRELLEIKKTCESGVSVPNVAQLMHDTIKPYCPQINLLSNFGVLDDHETGQLLIKVIPSIVTLSIQLPILLARHVPILKKGDNRTIYVSRKLVASLLANAFFCTFPNPGLAQSTPDFNFFTLYHTDPKYPASAKLKREKLKCIINYFEKISTDISGHHHIVSFERRCVSKKFAWSQCTKQLSAVTADTQGKIEDCRNMLQVDFANVVAGGGVYQELCVMEDIRFCISPELLVARLFTQNLEDNEVLVATGSEIFSEYTGYNQSFQYNGPSNLNFNQATDTLGRTCTQMVAMDAKYFKADNKQQQYQQSFLERELHKCYVAFMHGPSFVSSVATGNWGCGQFNGDKELKFLIQWMAASAQDRPKLQYHTIGDMAFAKEIENISDYLRKKRVQVDQLHKVVSKFHSDFKKHGKNGIFKYVKAKI